MRRDRLISRLHAALARRGAALIAGPGYGKTALASAFLAEYEHAGVWCDLAEHRGDALATVRQIVRNVEDVIRGVEPGSPGAGPPRAGQPGHGRRTAEHALEILDRLTAREADARAGSLLIVVDNLQLARPGSDLEACIDHLLRRLPPDWRVIVAGRAEPSSPELARLIQYGEVGALTEDDLAFTLDETTAFLTIDRPPDLARLHAGWVQSMVAGWPAGIVQFSRSLRPNSDVRPDAVTVDQTTYRFFARTVLAEVEPVLRVFLVRSSALPFVEAGLCDAALERSDSAERIAQLATEHLFLVRRPDRPGSYRFHGLFREFLLAELRSQLPAQEIRDLHRRAARHFLALSLIEEAVDQIIAAADWAELPALLRAHGASMIYSGRAATVLRWLERVPPEAISESPWLLLYRGFCLRILDLPGDLRGIQQRAQILFAREGERAGRAEALKEEANAAWLAREVAEAAALSVEALSIGDSDARVRVEILGGLMFYQLMLGRPLDARTTGHQALELLPQIQDAATRTVHHVMIKRQLGVAYAYGGDFHAGLVFLRQACDIARPQHVDEQTQVRARYVHGFVAAMRGDFEAALISFEAAEGIAREARLTEHVRRTRATRALVLATLGHIDAAEEQLQQAQWFADEWVDPGYFYYRSGRYYEAIDLCEARIAVCGPASNPVQRAGAQALLGAALVALGNVVGGRQLLEQALATYRASGFLSRTPGIALHLADIAFAEGREEPGRALLIEAIETAHRGGAYHFFVFHPAVLHRCLEQARVLGVEPQFVSALEQRWPDLGIQASTKHSPAHDATSRWFPHRGVLEPCPDKRVRADLALALTEGRVTLRGIQTLMSEYGLTWREVQVFVRYYLLRSGALPFDLGRPTRRRLDLAAELGVTEHTIRHHVNAIRGKIGVARQRSLAVYDWAVAQGIAG